MSRRFASRGFTLVELMVALSGGLFLSVVVFTLARDAGRFYQRENRLASATLAGMIGFERLKADIQRASYLSTPNIQSDPRIGQRPASPVGLQQLVGLMIRKGTPDLSGNAAFQANQAAGQTIVPDEIVIAGSFAATDEFPVSDASSGQQIFLQLDSAPMARLGYISASAPTRERLLSKVFSNNAILRLIDQAGQEHYGVITGVNASDQPSITLGSPLPVRASSGGAFGIRGLEVGASVNVVNRVRYQIRALDKEGSFKPLFAASRDAPGEDTRTELVREELDPTDQVLPNSTDIAAEYAVDLNFAVTGRTTPGAAALSYAETGAELAAFFGAGNRPQGVHAVRVRLSVRSREPDRDANVSVPGGGLYRFKVGGNGPWARVRTFQADVPLPNQTGITW